MTALPFELLICHLASSPEHCSTTLTSLSCGKGNITSNRNACKTRFMISQASPSLHRQIHYGVSSKSRWGLQLEKRSLHYCQAGDPPSMGANCDQVVKVAMWFAIGKALTALLSGWKSAIHGCQLRSGHSCRYHGSRYRISTPEK